MTLSVWHPDSDDDLRVTLSCSSDANPPVHSYIWYQGESCSTAADKSFFQGRQTLASSTGRGPTFSNITTENRGQHCCVALNQHGSQALTITLRGSTGGSVKFRHNTNTNTFKFRRNPKSREKTFLKIWYWLCWNQKIGVKYGFFLHNNCNSDV